MFDPAYQFIDRCTNHWLTVPPHRVALAVLAQGALKVYPDCVLWLIGHQAAFSGNRADIHLNT